MGTFPSSARPATLSEADPSKRHEGGGIHKPLDAEMRVRCVKLEKLGMSEEERIKCEGTWFSGQSEILSACDMWCHSTVLFLCVQRIGRAWSEERH